MKQDMTPQPGTSIEPEGALTESRAAEPGSILEKALQVMRGEATIGEMRGLTGAHLDAVYAMGYDFYGQGKYEAAEKVFSFLCLHNHRDARFWRGLGASRQMARNFHAAVLAYGMWGTLEPESPEPPMHASECYLSLGMRDALIAALTKTIHSARAKPEHAKLHDRAEAMLLLVGDRDARSQ